MKFVFSTDHHLHNYSEFAKPVSASLYGREVQTTDRVIDQLKALNQVFKIAAENDACLIFGGDFYHKRVSVHTAIYNLGIRAVDYNMKKYPNLELYMLVGNHDMTTNQMGCPNSLEPFNLIDRVHVVSRPKNCSVGDTQISFLPYGENINEMKEWLTKLIQVPAMNHNILVAHIGVDGASTGNYSHRLSGAFSLDDLHPHAYDYVLLGHYHKRQNLRENVLYGGNLIPTDFSDMQDKGVHLIDTDKHSIEFIPIESPKFLTFNESNISDLTDSVMKYNYVRVQLPEKTMKKIESKLSISEDQVPENVRLEKKKTYDIESRIDIDVTSDERTIVSKYADQYCPSAKQKALDILKEVQL